MNRAAALLMGVVFVGAEGAPALAAQECGAIANLKIENTNLLSATEVPAAGDLPAYCRVLGFVRPAINFEIRMPLQGWNGKFYMAGCGGFCGTLDADRPGFTNELWPPAQLRRLYDGLGPLGNERPGWPMGNE